MKCGDEEKPPGRISLVTLTNTQNTIKFTSTLDIS